MKKAVKAKIEVKGTETRGEVIWTFELVKSGAFQYGNGTAVAAKIEGRVDGGNVKDSKYYDTRYYKGITSEEGFTEFCIETVKDFYGENAVSVEEVRS